VTDRHALEILRRERSIVGRRYRVSINSSASARLSPPSLQWVQIHYHQINRRDAMLCRLFLSAVFFRRKSSPLVHFRMQRFHSSAEHFRPARKIETSRTLTPASRSSFAVPPVERISISAAASASQIPRFLFCQTR